MESEGALDANAGLPMPRAALRIGLVTAEDSAACHDFLQTLRESRFPFRVYAAWSQMQGERAVEEILQAFNRLLTVPHLDAVVLTRGGGSPADLSWMNSEHIGRMISQVPWPVISGIGHETDSTLPDFVSHTRAKTPTHAAGILVDLVADLSADIEALAVQLHHSVSRATSRALSRLALIASALSRHSQFRISSLSSGLDNRMHMLERSVGSIFRHGRRNLDRLADGLRRAMTSGMQGRRSRELDTLEKALRDSAERQMERLTMKLDSFQAILSASDPRNLYRKGWATVRASDGTLLRSVSRVNLDDAIRISLNDGSITARTTGIVKGRDDDDAGEDIGS
jgi:exodeoxyribonuclease VII large subunit